MSSSILTNTSAMSALQTLQSINEQLDKTQNEISSGLRVSSASDNAAYWSIATTMKSDNQSLSAVSDALGLGSSTVDTAYTAMDSVIDSLNDIKARLVTAQQPGVDKSKIQSEIASLQQQIQSTAQSASFSGSNFLSIDSATQPTTQDVVSSLSRDSNGQISLGTIQIDLTQTALFDSNPDSAGLLQQSLGNTSTAGLTDVSAAGDWSGGSAPTAGTNVITKNLSYTNSGAADGSLVVDLSVDGGATQKVSVNVAAGSTATTTDLAAAISDGLANGSLSGFTASVDTNGNLTLTSDTTGASSAVSVSLDGSTPSTIAATSGTSDFSDTATPTAGVAGSGGSQATASFTTNFSAVSLDSDDTLSFDIAVDGGASKTITIDKNTVDTALGASANGTIATAADMSTVLNQALVGTGVATTSTGTTVTLDDTTSATGTASSIAISNVQASAGANSFSLMDLDITNATSDQISSYMNGIDKMISSVTNVASDLGAKKSQITSQTDFISSLMDTIDSGVGTLVDADMNEASTKLKALQTQQQLGIQALSIANSNSSNILSLFR